MTKASTRYMTVNNRLVFLKVQDDERNERLDNMMFHLIL